MLAKGKVTRKIINYLKKNIQNGTWQVGDKLPSENTLCQELQVSRVSVRNAIQQFVSVGILEVQHGKGTFLISSDLSAYEPSQEYKLKLPESMDDMRMLLEFRLMVEPSVIEKVAKTASPELIDRLTELLQTMRNSIGDTSSFVAADMQFHLEICAACQNPFMNSIMKDVFAQKTLSANLLNLANGYYGGIYYHSMLIDTLKKHDSKKAKAIMTEHLNHGIDDLQIMTDE